MVWKQVLRKIVIASALLAGLGYGQESTADPSSAATEPLVIAEQGSFFIGGETLNRGLDDDVTIHQMYVQYQVPAGDTEVPVVMTHGCCLSSATWETTPDGRMGWDEYFLRQ